MVNPEQKVAEVKSSVAGLQLEARSPHAPGSAGLLHAQANSMSNPAPPAPRSAACMSYLTVPAEFALGPLQLAPPGFAPCQHPVQLAHADGVVKPAGVSSQASAHGCVASAPHPPFATGGGGALAWWANGGTASAGEAAMTPQEAPGAIPPSSLLLENKGKPGHSFTPPGSWDIEAPPITLACPSLGRYQPSCTHQHQQAHSSTLPPASGVDAHAQEVQLGLGHGIGLTS